MTFSLPLLLIALALLWVPRAWMRKGMQWTVRKKRSHHRQDDWHSPVHDGVSLSARREFTRARNYFDFLRAAAGAFAIFGGLGVEAAVRTSGGSRERAALLAVQGTILLIGLIIQLVRWERRLCLSAPVFYICGLTLGLGLPVSGISAFVIAWVLSPVAPSAQSFLLVYALIVAGVGAAFGRIPANVVIAASLAFLPVLVSLLARRPLVVFTRRAAPSAHPVDS